ncbi:hypothetical protein BGZ65_001269, partial [Modicella reniformis]
MQSKGWDVKFCPTEADVEIASDCQLDDIVVSRDSDFLICANIATLYRPLGRGEQMKFLLYSKQGVLEVLGLTAQQLLVLGIVSKNDYGSNIPSLGIKTNNKLVKDIPDQD